MLIASVGFSLMLLSVKMLPKGFPTHEIVFFRSLVSIIITLVMLKMAKVKPIFGHQKGILILRGVFGVIALSLFFYTVQNIPLASAVTIQYTSPIFTILFGIFLLKEKVTPAQWLLFFLAFAGVAMVKGVDTNLPWLFLLCGLTSAIFSGLAYNMIRMVRKTDHPYVVVLYFPLVAIPVMGVWCLLDWQQPTLAEFGWLLAAGIFTQVGQVFMTMSYHQAQLVAVSGIRYLGIVYALAYGYFFFDETYSWLPLVGMTVVVLAVLVNIFLKAQIEKRRSSLPED